MGVQVPVMYDPARTPKGLSLCYIINVASREERLTFSQGFLFVLDELSVKYGRASFQRLLILVSFAM